MLVSLWGVPVHEVQNCSEFELCLSWERYKLVTALKTKDILPHIFFHLSNSCRGHHDQTERNAEKNVCQWVKQKIFFQQSLVKILWTLVFFDLTLISAIARVSLTRMEWNAEEAHMNIVRREHSHIRVYWL